MPSPVYIDFIARGMPDIARAFRSVQNIVTGTETQSTNAVLKGSRARISAREREARETVKAMRFADREVSKAWKRGDAEAAAGSRARTSSINREAREQIAIWKRADNEVRKAQKFGAAEGQKAIRFENAQARRQAKADADARIQIAKNTEKVAATVAKNEAATAARLESNKVKLAEQGAKAKISAMKKADAAQAQAQRAGVAEARRHEREKETEAARRKRREEADGRRNYNRNEVFGRAIAGAAGRGVTQAAHMGYRAASSVAGAFTQLGGGFTVAGAVGEAANLERSAALLANSAYDPSDAGVKRGMDKRQDPKEIIKQAKADSIATGIDANELVEGTRDYVRLASDFKGGQENQRFFGKLAKGTGTKYADIAKAAGQIRMQNQEATPEQMHQMLLNIVAQGKGGSVEIEQLAGSAGKIMKTSSMYQGDQATNQNKLLALSQFAAKTSGGSVNEAATELSNLGSDSLKHHKDISRAVGTNIVDKDGALIAPEKLLATVLEKTGGNIGAIQGLGYGQRSLKMFEALAPDYQRERDRLRATGASDKVANAGAGAFIQKKMEGMIGAKYTDKDVEQDFATVMKSSAEQFEQAVRQLKTMVGETLIPQFMKLVAVLETSMPTLKRWLDGMVKMADWVATNPMSALFIGLGAAVAKEVVGQIAVAGIGKIIAKLLGGAAGGGPVPVGAGGAAGGAGAAGALGAGAAAAAATYLAYKPGVDAALGGQVKGQGHVGQLLADIKNGTPEQKAAAAAEFEKARNTYGGAGGAAKLAFAAGQLPFGLLNEVTGGKNHAAEELSKGMAAREVASNPELAALVEALRANTIATTANTAKPNAPGPSPGGGPPPPGGSARNDNILVRNPF